jgi:Flp pilus assembly protein TadG
MSSAQTPVAVFKKRDRRGIRRLLNTRRQHLQRDVAAAVLSPSAFGEFVAIGGVSTSNHRTIANRGTAVGRRLTIRQTLGAKKAKLPLGTLCGTSGMVKRVFRHMARPALAAPALVWLPRRVAVRSRRLLRALGDNGVTAVEFAIVAPMFLLLLTTIVDLGVMLTTQFLLDGAARDAARLIRTGQVQTSSSPMTTFQNLLCSDLSPVMSSATCQSSVIFEVQVFTNFAGVSFTPCTQNSNANQSGYCSFNTGAGTQIVGVQVNYNYPFMVPWVGACLTGGSCWFGAGTTSGTNPGRGTAPLVSTVVFMNEPFPSS